MFGGGLGTGATIYGNPKVNINMIQGAFHGQSPAKDNPNELGAIGTVYGGGNAADIVGSTTVNIGWYNAKHDISDCSWRLHQW